MSTRTLAVEPFLGKEARVVVSDDGPLGMEVIRFKDYNIETE